ncbi:MAG TPA: hypothetical protein K8V32_14485 [Enteractinococcus helveticum]|uniref:Uncharacterized protein n=1 Tax=Enteractinococcus helveticum TaxID=1837282 RepID=A0A921FPW6_9MICC|nr:hypothetical protein [Enteractinococcus helveticum]HJF15973.1 hypothetical protein [Enteractinococcus helveticum]
MSSTDGSSDWGFGRKKKKLRPGDGHRLKPFRVWQGLTRSLFYAPLETSDGGAKLYAVNVNYFDWDDTADLYLDGVHTAQADLPAEFPVEGGTIEVATSTYGLKRMHFVDRTGQARVLKPDPASAEGLRARFAQRAPRTSRLIGILAVVILLTLLPIGLLDLAEIITHTEFAQQYIDPFTSPIRLPDWATTPALVLSILAALERALTLRNHWLIDMDTGWFD